MMNELLSGPTPSQTVGPYLHIVLPWSDGPEVVPAGTPGAIVIRGRLTDGAGDPVPDGLIETWQAGPDGAFDHPDDPRGPGMPFRGFARCPTDADGGFAITTMKPGALPDGAGGQEAPHLDVSIFARGMLNRVVTRIYFPDEELANAGDPVLRAMTTGSAARLTALPDAAGGLRFDVRLQGENQTPFFAL